MMTTANICTDRPALRRLAESRPPSAWVGWLKLLVGLGLLWLLIFVLAPALQQVVPQARTLGEYITRNDISAGALYYTEVEEVGESETSIRDTFRFMPGRQE
jgi:hypothetical protein